MRERERERTVLPFREVEKSLEVDLNMQTFRRSPSKINLKYPQG